MALPSRWDLDYDVVVAGYGFAGAMAAVTAHDAGVEVGLFEKMAHFGGNSIISGGFCLIARDEDGARQYMHRTSGNATDVDVIDTYARGLVELPDILGKLAEEVGFKTLIWERHRGATYPTFPGADSLASIYVTRNERYKGFPWAKGIKAGGTLFWVVAEHVQRRSGIDVRFKSPIRELITDAEGGVVGVVVESEGQRLNVRARRAVVLCTGGFEHNERLRLHYLQIQGATAVSPLGNTGDGVLMAQKAGAALWHMWLVHGGYGFKVPGVPVAIRHTFAGWRNEERQMPWIAVDRFGRRFMDEYPPAPQDTGIRPLEYYDADIQDYPRIPCYLIFDEDARRLGPIAAPLSNDEEIDFTWSADNLQEVEKGYILKADSTEELAERLRLECEALVETVERWNAHCAAGRDKDFRRPPATMVPIARPPFYGIAAWPIITNTQGGPVHNAKQQVMDPYGRPISRLYAAGELGSLFGHLYALCGNNSECFIAGKIAGEQAAAEAPWC